MNELIIPTNFQDDFFEKINFSAVKEVYGKMKSDPIGGGRSSMILQKININKLKKHIDILHKKNIKFNYLLNATCLNNDETTSSGYKMIRNFLDVLAEAKVDLVTVALPFLAILIKKHYPMLKISVSTQAMVDCLQRVKYWEELGCDTMTLSYVDLNRNFSELKKIVRKSLIKFQLIANLVCRANCPFQIFHGNLNSHASQNKHKHKGFAIDYYTLFCLDRVFSDPKVLIKTTWIRPEDTKFYNEIGINRFKLVERGMTSDALSLIIDAYTNNEYNGNFIDLIPTMSKYINISSGNYKKTQLSFVRPDKVNVFKIWKVFKKWGQLSSAADYYREFDIYVDNKKLDGVVKHFYDGACKNDCENTCDFCSNMGKKAVNIKVNKSEYNSNLKELKSVVEHVIDGDIFYYKDKKK